MSQPFRQQSRPRRWMTPGLVGIVALVVVAAIGLYAWSNALTTPVVKAGAPTTKVTLPAAKPTASATASTPAAPSGSASAAPSTSASASAPASPTASAKPSESAKPSPTPTPTPTKTAKPKPVETFATSTKAIDSVSGTGKLQTYIVKVEVASKLKVDEVAAEIAAVLNDARSWAGSGTVRFGLVKDARKADFTIYVSTPSVADATCKDTAWLCARGSNVILSAKGWATPSDTFGGDATAFRRWLVNYGAGQFLDRDTSSCSKAGQPAPVMSNQGDDLKGCVPNPWPYG